MPATNLHTVVITTAGGAYAVHIGHGILARIGRWLEEGVSGRRILLVSHPQVAELYGARVEASLREAGFRVETVLVPAGERSKSLRQGERLYRRGVVAGLDRGSVVVALGGGVVSDLAGFVAATYMRGIAWADLPTTLLAQVDASVGGKVAINLPEGKNLVGAFHQPLVVVADVDTLMSLPMREIRCGLAEIIKHSLILDADLFERIAVALGQAGRVEGLPLFPGRRLSWELVEYGVRRSCELKGWVVGQDEREGGLRALLNFGHTVGHALETLMGYRRLHHGEAVAVGMITAALLSRQVLRLTEGETQQIRDVISRAGLPTAWPPVEPEAVWQTMQRDKKFVAGRARFALLRAIGQGEVVEVEEAAVRAALEAHRRLEG